MPGLPHANRFFGEHVLAAIEATLRGVSSAGEDHASIRTTHLARLYLSGSIPSTDRG